MNIEQQLLARHGGDCRLQTREEVHREDLPEAVVEQEVQGNHEEELGEHRERQVPTQTVQVVLEEHVHEHKECVTDQEGLVDQPRVRVTVETIGA